MTEAWRDVFRRGIAPQLSTPGLQALRKALASDDSRLLQGGTVSPPPLRSVMDWPVEAACLIGFCGWQGDGLETVADVEEFFARVCFEADQALQEPAACRHTLNFWDETPREELKAKFLPEIELVLAQRSECERHAS